MQKNAVLQTVVERVLDRIFCVILSKTHSKIISNSFWKTQFFCVEYVYREAS